MKKKLLLSLFLCLVVIAGCEDDEDDIIPVDTSVIMPLAAGNLWEYAGEEFDLNGNIKSVTPYYLGVNKDTLIDTVRWYVLNDGTLARNTDSGLVRVHNYSSGLFYKYPADAGDIFVWDNFTTIVQAQYIPVQVTVGTYNCYKYALTSQTDPTFDTMYSYVAPGYGLILREWTVINTGMETMIRRWSLVDFQIHR